MLFRSIAAAQRALALAMAGGDVVLQGQATHFLGLAYWAQNDYRRAIDCDTQAMASFDRAGRHGHFGDTIRLPLAPVSYLPGAMPSWAGSPRAGVSGTQGCGLPRKWITPRV